MCHVIKITHSTKCMDTAFHAGQTKHKTLRNGPFKTNRENIVPWFDTFDDRNSKFMDSELP